MFNHETYTLTLKRETINKLLLICNQAQGITLCYGEDWNKIQEIHDEIKKQRDEKDELLKKARTPKVGSWYRNEETPYKALKACTGKDEGAYWVRSEAGWICKAWNVKTDGDTQIEWSHSTNGFWEGENLC